MTGTGSVPPTLYRPAEVAAMLRCSEWWVKEQARRRRIPYCWIGGGYRFTDAHIAEIAQLCEVRPVEHVNGAGTEAVASVVPVLRLASGSSGQLRARPPRRHRGSDSAGASAA